MWMAQPETGHKVLLVSSDHMVFNREKIRNEMLSERLVIFQVRDEESCPRGSGREERKSVVLCVSWALAFVHVRKY